MVKMQVHCSLQPSRSKRETRLVIGVNARRSISSVRLFRGSISTLDPGETCFLLNLLPGPNEPRLGGPEEFEEMAQRYHEQRRT